MTISRKVFRSMLEAGRETCRYLEKPLSPWTSSSLVGRETCAGRRRTGTQP